MRKISLLVLAICSFPGAFAQAYSVLADSASIREWFEDGIRTIRADSSLERVTPYTGENFSIIFYHENFSPKDSRYYEFATPEQWAAGVRYPLVDKEDKSTGFIYPHLSGYCYLAERYTPADKEYKGH